MITYEQVQSILYYYYNKDDHTRSVFWDDCLEDIKRDFPEVWAAHVQLIVAKKTLNAVLHQMADSIPFDPN